MKIKLVGATEQIARKKEVRAVLSRVDIERGDLIHRFNVWLDCPDGLSIDTVKLLDYQYIDIRIYASHHELKVSLNFRSEEVLGVEVIND